MASAPYHATLSTSSLSHHPSPAPSSASSPPSPSSSPPSPNPTSPTSSTSSQDSRKRKRDEFLATPLLLLPPPHSLSIERDVHASSNMSTWIFGGIWKSLKGFAGFGVSASPPVEEVEEAEEAEEAPESPTKRARIETSLGDDGRTNKEEPILTQTPDKEALHSQTDKEGSILSQVPNKEALRSQANGRSGLKIKAPTSTDKQTPPQQLPSPLASSSEDEGESQFKKSTTTRTIRPLPRIAPVQLPTNNGPLEQNERPFFAEPLHKKRDSKVILQRALARREAYDDPGMNYVPLASRFPLHLHRNVALKNFGTPIPRSRPAHFTSWSPQGVWESMRTPERTRKTDVLGHLTTGLPKRVAPKKGRIQKTVQENYAKSQARSQAENESLEALLKQLIADKAEGFHSFEEVAKRRQERAKDVQRMREADTKVDKIPPLTSAQLELLKKTVTEVEQDHRLDRNKRYIEKFRIPINTSDLFRMRPNLWLNDEVINFYMNMIVDRSKKEHPNEPQKILVHNTFFFPQLSKGGYKSVARWAKRLGVFGEGLLKLDYMFVPVHVSRTHWCLAVANFKLKRFEYYDSLGGNFSPDSMPGLYGKIREYVENETGKSFADWANFSMAGAPQQANSSDCGVFTIKTAETIARGGKMSFSASDMPLIRQRVMVEVLGGELLPWVVEN